MRKLIYASEKPDPRMTCEVLASQVVSLFMPSYASLNNTNIILNFSSCLFPTFQVACLVSGIHSTVCHVWIHLSKRIKGGWVIIAVRGCENLFLRFLKVGFPFRNEFTYNPFRKIEALTCCVTFIYVCVMVVRQMSVARLALSTLVLHLSAWPVSAIMLLQGRTENYLCASVLLCTRIARDEKQGRGHQIDLIIISEKRPVCVHAVM